MQYVFVSRCILSAMSPFFRQQLKKSPKIEMKVSEQSELKHEF